MWKTVIYFNLHNLFLHKHESNILDLTFYHLFTKLLSINTKIEYEIP
jgi:hypothetical protein